MSKIKDLTGQKFGRLTVIKRAPNKPNDAHAYWLCHCDCGNEVVYRGTNLIQGRAKSCGCITKKDLTRQKFGHLTVLNYAYSKGGERYWYCQCDCGNFISVRTKSLTSGNTQSCGCLHHKKIVETNIKTKSKIDQTNIIGQHFDFLEVIDIAPSRNGFSYYLCKCHKCGNFKEIRYSDLISGKVHACGCLQSYGEQQLKEALLKNNILFKTQYRFNDLLSDKQYPLRFDFGILDINNNLICLIEYQGQQHTDITNPWYNDTLVKHDNMKRQYCKEHNIKLYYCDKNTDISSFIKEVVLPMSTIGV